MLKTILCTTLLLMHLVTCQECIDGELRTVPVTNSGSSTHTDIPQYCSNGEWMMFCASGAATYTQETLNVMCRHLGYSDQGASNQTGACSVALTADFIRPSIACTGTEQTITGCPLETLESCSCNDIVRLECQQAKVENETVRLFGGSTNKEGTVQVYRDGRWETICTTNQEGIATALCSTLGLPPEAYTGASLGFFAPISPPSFNCTIQNGTLQCGNTSCDHLSPSLGVACKTHQEVVQTLVNETRHCKTMLNERIETLTEINETLLTCKREYTTHLPNQDSIVALVAIVGLILAVSLITTVGWIVTCCKLLKNVSSKDGKPNSRFPIVRNDSYILQQAIYEGTTPLQTNQIPNYPAVTTSIEDIDPQYDVAIQNPHTISAAPPKPARARRDQASKRENTEEHTYDVILSDENLEDSEEYMSIVNM